MDKSYTPLYEDIQGNEISMDQYFIEGEIARRYEEEIDYLKRRIVELEDKQRKFLIPLQAKAKLQQEDVHSLYQVFYIEEFKKEVSFLHKYNRKGEWLAKRDSCPSNQK